VLEDVNFQKIKLRKKQNTSALLSEVVVSAGRHCRKPDQLITFYSQQFS